jgi:hypothetical protein
MYRRPKFLEILIEIRHEMAQEADYDVDLFAELQRSGKRAGKEKHSIVPFPGPGLVEMPSPIAELRRSRLKTGKG